jgi:putative phosphoribosyl transferase
VRIPLPGGPAVVGDLVQPPSAGGIVVFAHGSGSSRHSPRNQQVASHLQDLGLATLLLDLLSPDEEQIDLQTRHLRFDVELLAHRLTGAADWVRAEPSLLDLPIGYFGASTGAAAALIAAADRLEGIAAVVSRGGRPDLAGDHLASVRCPTLLIVGSADPEVLALNRAAMAPMRSEVALQVVEGATHLFEEPGALEQVAEAAGNWFTRHLMTAASRPPTAR